MADFGAARPGDGCRVRLHPLAYQVPPLRRLAKLPLVLHRRVPPAFLCRVRRCAQVALVAAALVAWRVRVRVRVRVRAVCAQGCRRDAQGCRRDA